MVHKVRNQNSCKCLTFNEHRVLFLTWSLYRTAEKIFEISFF